jgi:hypothetical protein
MILVHDCFYAADTKDEMVRDRLICGTNNQRIREKLLQSGSELTLAEAIKIARTYTETQAQLKTMSAEGSMSNPAIKQEAINPANKQDAIKKNLNSRIQKASKSDCYFCGGENSVSHNCPARGKACNDFVCGKQNHFA